VDSREHLSPETCTQGPVHGRKVRTLPTYPENPHVTRSAWPAAVDLVRHGESEGNLADQRAHDLGAPRLELTHRDADVELSPTGLDQAAALGEWLSLRDPNLQPTVVMSSPYARALRTAEAAIDGGDLDVPLVVDERLRERDLGLLDGMTGLGVRQEYPEEAERRRRLGKLYYRPPYGESWCDVALRIRDVLRDLRESYAGERVLITSHQAVIMNFRFVLEGLTERELLAVDAGPPLTNCSLTRYVRGPHGLALEVFNDPQTMASMGEKVTKEPDADPVP
jgi:broad specificity phosphatase PhoE